MNDILKQLFLAFAIVLTFIAATSAQQSSQPRPLPDAVDQAQRSQAPPVTRPEQNRTPHDQSTTFEAENAKPASDATNDQPNKGRITGFDFFRDPLNSDRPNIDPSEIVKKESANKLNVMNAHRQVLERRYNLQPKTDTAVKMARGKLVPIGPTARLPQGMSWDQISALSAADIKQRDIFPYRSLPHPLQANGGQVFPKMQIEMFARLERFDVDFDLPDAFIPEFPRLSF